MQIIIGAVIFILLFIAIAVMVVINFTYKGVRKIKEEVEENYYRTQKRKEQKERNPFSHDYFKGASSTKREQPKQEKTWEEIKREKNPFGDDYFKSATSASSSSRREQPQQEEPKEDTARRTTTSSGVTIIDDRGSDKRKIFDHDDGEYVEYEEVN